MSVEMIINQWKRHQYKPTYWLEGDEPYFIDQIVDYAEHRILSESEAGFNLTVFYGRDADWASVMNACMRYPMFSDKQVVILKEAQQMKEIERLESYIDNPLASTIFVVSYKDKKVDGRSKFAKVLKQKGEMFTTKKVYDNQLPEWTSKIVQQNGCTINPKALMLLVDHIGNDLSRIENEVVKLSLNLTNHKNITEHDIETYIGVSKDYNIYELQNAVIKKDFAKTIRIIQYFESNPKAAPIQMILPALYTFFTKVYMIFGAGTNDEKSLASILGVNIYFINDYLLAVRNYNLDAVEKILLLLQHYNLRSIGVHDSGTSDSGLMKELVFKIMH